MELRIATAIALAKQHIRGAFQLTNEIIVATANASWDTIKR